MLFGLFDGLPMWTKPGVLIWVLIAWAMISADVVSETAAPNSEVAHAA
jgi:hypothetical protein